MFVYDIQRDDLICISRTLAGATGNGSSLWPRISADGSRVAFHSFASDLVEGDDNGRADVFLYDAVTGRLECVSRTADGTAADGPSAFAALDGTGDWVAFVSTATDLIPDGGSDHAHVYLFDRARGSVERISRAPGGEPANGASGFADVASGGRHIVFQTAADNLVPHDTNGLVDVFWHDRRTGVTRCLSRGLGDVAADGASCFPAISSDGSRAAFQSRATNLVEGDTNGASDIFVIALTPTARPRRVSLAADGTQADADSTRPALDAAGRRLIFVSRAANLTADAVSGQPGIFATPLETAAPLCLSRGHDGRPATEASLAPRMAGNGRFAVFESPAVNLVGAGSPRGTGVLRAAWMGPE